MRSLEMWRKGSVIKAGRENQKRHKNEQQNLISKADVQKGDEGENDVNARQIFKHLEENVNTEVNMSDYACIRSPLCYVVFQLVIGQVLMPILLGMNLLLLN